MAVIESGSTPRVFSRSKVSLRLKPASIRRRVRPVATRAQFPELEEARTVMETMAGILTCGTEPSVLCLFE
jgi:hypothetical protein